MKREISNWECWTRALFCLLILGHTISTESKAQVNFPQFLKFKMPSPAPPAPGDVFSPKMSGTANKNTPAIGEWTRTAGPDESMVLVGVDLSNYQSEHEGKDTRFSVYGKGGILKDAKIQRLDGDKVLVTLDKSLPEWSMYLLWPGNENGYGEPIAINQTDAWWIGPEKTTSGTSISVYGRNLSQNNDTITSNILIKAKGMAGQWAEVLAVNPYRVEFVVPSDLANGEYEVWTHNGHGGAYGWSGPLSLSIEEPLAWDGTVFNVAEFGAKGDGATDDTDAIQQAIAAAEKSHGSTIYFPKGEYMITDMLRPSSNTKWQGESRDFTTIRCGANFSGQAAAMVYGSITNFQIDDISFDTDNNYNGIHAEPIFLRGSSNLKLNNIFFSFANNNVLQLDNTSNVFITNCKMVGKISFLGKASQLFIDHCNFFLTNDAELALHSWGGVGVSVTNSTCQDFDNSSIDGWGKGRFYVAAGNFGSGKYTYIANNKTKDLAVRESNDVDQNSGEQFLWEGFTTLWSGSVVDSSPSATTLNGFSESLKERKYAVIIEGRGLGQSREIVSANGSSISLVRPWNVEPDRTSTIAVGHFADRIVLYNNYIDGKASNVFSPNHNASSGIQPYGGVQNFIADNNIIQEVRSALANWGTQHEEALDPNYFSLFINNEIFDSRWGIQNGVDMNRAEGIAILGATYRNNKVSNTIESGIVNTVFAGSKIVFNSFIYEHNTLANVKNGFSTGGDIGLPNGFSSHGQNLSNQMFYKNKFISDENLTYGIKVTAGTILRENSYEGFEIPYLEPSPMAVLEAPFHSIEILGDIGGGIVISHFTLWNSGTGIMNWNATTDASWLDLPIKRGSINNEWESQTLKLIANPVMLSEGSHRATITIMTEDQIKKYTILFKVANLTESRGSRNVINLNTGTNDDVFFSGETYYGDTQFDSYFNSSNTHTNVSASTEALYQTERNGKHLSYSIPIPNGIYTVYTHHNELWFGWKGPYATVGRRVFDITIEDTLLKNDFDIFLEGSNQPTTLKFENIEVIDGELNVDMTASANNASISGISIEPKFGSGSLQWRTIRDTNSNSTIMALPRTETDGVKVSLYPNPANTETVVSIHQGIDIDSIIIYNMAGELIKIYNPPQIKTHGNKYFLPLQDIQQGMYLVMLVTEDDFIKNRRLIIKR